MIFLGIESFARHMSSEGHQLQQGMAFNGWQLCGKNLKHNSSNLYEIFDKEPPQSPLTIIQDEREWNPRNPCCIDKGEEFIGLEALNLIPERYKISIIKDAQWFKYKPESSEEFCQRYGIKRFICYYNPTVVEELSGIQKDCLIRTYHSVDKDEIPEFNQDRLNCALISGANSSIYYPFRAKLIEQQSKIRNLHYLEHPGYGASGSCTPRYLSELNKYKIAICTASIYQYCLRKIIEATTCGCIVLTNLKEEVPWIDDNLIRIREDMMSKEIERVIQHHCNRWDADKQKQQAQLAKERYDYRVVTRILSESILAAP